MKWMAHFDRPCHFLCCRAVDCASIQCLFCRKSLTSATGTPPVERYECAECEPVGCESFTTGLTAVISATTMCAACFIHPNAAPHRHSSLYLRVDPAGGHSAVSRPVPPAAVHALQLHDLMPLPHVRGKCQCLGEDFSEDEPAVAAAFCKRGHGIAAFRDANGRTCEPFDTGTFYCAPCSLMWARERGLDQYDNPDLMCSLCAHDREMQRWREEFAGERRSAESAGELDGKLQQLKQVHQQPWIRALADEVFGA